MLKVQLPTPSCLQKIAKVLEEHEQRLCPFERIETQFGEGIEFNYAKTTRPFIDAFGLNQIGKTRNINISASIDATKITKNLMHTTAGLKMSDVAGCNPMTNKQSFILDDMSL
jgi:hypothetical protein